MNVARRPVVKCPYLRTSDPLLPATVRRKPRTLHDLTRASQTLRIVALGVLSAMQQAPIPASCLRASARTLPLCRGVGARKAEKQKSHTLRTC